MPAVSCNKAPARWVTFRGHYQPPKYPLTPAILAPCAGTRTGRRACGATRRPPACGGSCARCRSAPLQTARGQARRQNG
eukprot:9355400-Pyramimonas_sp.AAC.1